MKRFSAAALLLLLVFIIPVMALADLEIYYLDVGQADAAFIRCDGHSMMIDGGNPDDSQFIYSFLKNTVNVTELDCVIASHPHDDHIGGLGAAFRACKVGILYTTMMEYDSRHFESLLNYAAKQGTSIIVPYVRDHFQLGGAEVTFLSPIYEYDD